MSQILMDAEKKILYLNQEGCRFFGYSAYELEGCPISKILENQECIRKGGERLPVSFQRKELTFSSSPVFLISIHHSFLFYYKEFIENFPLPLLLTDHAGIIKSSNPLLQKLFEYEEAELQGQAVEILLPSSIKEKHVQLRNDYLHAHPTPRPMGEGRELYGITKSGKEVPLEVGLYPMEVEGQKYVIAGVIDIQKRKEQENTLHTVVDQLGENNQELKEFTYEMSYSLQEPFRRIHSFAHLFEEEYPDILTHESKEYLHHIKEAAEHGFSLLENLLTLSKIVTEQQPKNYFSLSALFHQVLGDLQLQIQTTEASVEIGNLAHIEGEERQIYLLFEHLIQNALRYRLDKSTPFIRISGFEEGDLYTLKFENNGSSPLVGFDLALCKKILGHHRGELKVGTGEEGTAVTLLSFPLKKRSF